MTKLAAQTIQAAWDAFVLAISEGKSERESVIRAIEAADESRARMVHEIIRKRFGSAA